MQHLKHAYFFFKSHFDHLSKPNPSYISNKITFELVHQRNKSFVLIEILVIASFIINLLTKTGPLSSNLQGAVVSIIIVFIFFLTCRSHPETFRTVYNIANCLYGVSLTQHGFEGSHGAWQATLVFPSLVYLFTGSLPQYLMSCTAQTFILNTYLPQFLERSVREMDPEDFVRSFTYYTNQTISFSVISVILMHFMIENAYVRISEAETKRENFERQKNFLLGFSHELRNLINSLMGNVKLATLETTLTDKVRELLLNAEVCSELLLHMVNNILDTGKVEIGDLEINPSPVRIYDTMERVWSVCSELIKRKSLRGRMRIQKNIPEILNLDHYRLTQIFLNLIGNAVKFTDVGGIDVNVEWMDNYKGVSDKCFEPRPFNEENDTDEGIFEKKQAFSLFDDSFFFLSFGSKKINKDQLRPASSQGSGILKIIVSDTGIGMGQEDVGKLFQRFTQVTSDVSKRKLGTGLGLFITKELVQRMKGDIKVYSKKGKGTAFIICLPVEPSLEVGGNFADIESMKSVISRRNLRAMVVDDQAYSRTLISDFLSNLQVNVIEKADNGLSAYLKFMERSNKGDLLNIITLDLDMPILNGKVAAQRIREMERQKGGRPCMIIVISGNCVDSEIKECVDKNGLVKADAFLKKPISMEDLGRVIANHFGPCCLEKTSTSSYKPFRRQRV